jgi:hypothetical protein
LDTVTHERDKLLEAGHAGFWWSWFQFIQVFILAKWCVLIPFVQYIEFWALKHYDVHFRTGVGLPSRAIFTAEFLHLNYYLF